MNTRIIIGGYIWHPRKEPTPLHCAENPTKADVALLLEGIRGQKGTVVAYKKPCPEVGPYRMSIYTQEGRYVVVVGASWPDDELSPCLSLVNEDHEASDSGVILQRVFTDLEIFRQFDVVSAAFEKFALEGKIDLERYIAASDPEPR